MQLIQCKLHLADTIINITLQAALLMFRVMIGCKLFILMSNIPRLLMCARQTTLRLIWYPFYSKTNCVERLKWILPVFPFIRVIDHYTNLIICRNFVKIPVLQHESSPLKRIIRTAAITKIFSLNLCNRKLQIVVRF